MMKTKVIEIYNGEMNKRIIEDFFDLLIADKKVVNSRALKYFLSASDEAFKSRKTRVKLKKFSIFKGKRLAQNNKNQI